ncbi:MAG: hypothetical protein WA851_04235 [Xanthobacteraceae bacterium]
MLLQRLFAVAFVLLVSPILTAEAFAGCNGCGPPPGPALAPPPGPAFTSGPCGVHCVAPYGRALPALSPMEPVAVAAAPVAVDHWDTNGFGDCRGPGDYFGACGGFAGCGPGPCGAPPPCIGCRHPVVAYRPGPGVYIVNQGPEYSGPNFFVPFKTYTPTTGLAAPSQFPYISARHVYHPPLDVRG